MNTTSTRQAASDRNRRSRHPHRTAIAMALSLALAGVGGLALSAPVMAQAAPAEATTNYAIPAGSLKDALDALASQGKVSVLFSPALVEGKTTKGLSGRHAPEQALRLLLAGTGLAWEAVDGGTFVLKRAPAAPVATPAKPQARSKAPAEEEVKNMPAIMVTGTKSLNMDITRTEDDPQPYVVFDREQIERSGATSLEQFLQQRLTMNTANARTGDSVSTSRITLRGLSATQTLILIDGHRASSPAFSNVGPGRLSQTDITGLPISAVERIEVLPTTASGIYGGGATGGVINIILRRDYTGGEIKLTYDNTFKTDTASRKVDFTFGHNFNEGNTNLLLTASHAEANELLLMDRNFAQRGRDAMLANNPAYFSPPVGRPPLGATPNIASAHGSDLILKDGTSLGAPITYVPEGYKGVTSDGGAALVGNAGSFNWNLANTMQSDVRGSGGRRALYEQPTTQSGAVVLRHRIGDDVQMFGDLSSSRSVNRFRTNSIASAIFLPSTSSTNPFIQDIRITAPLPFADSWQEVTMKQDRALIGIVKSLPYRWQVGADYIWDKTSITWGGGITASGLTEAILAGEVDVLRDTSTFPVDLGPYIGQAERSSPFASTMQDITLRASGPTGRVPGGEITMSVSLAHRREEVADARLFFPASNSAIFYPERSQSINSAYLETSIPIFSERNAKLGMHGLELQLSVRHDRYVSTSGATIFLAGDSLSLTSELSRARNRFTSSDPTVALRWEPTRNLTLRTSYGTGFVPPALDQLVPAITSTPIFLGEDPLRDNEPAGPAILITGGNPNLEPEQSESWSAGFILAPTENFRLSVDYTRIRKKDNIAFHPRGTQGIIDDEALFPGRITRGPNRPGDPSDWAGPITQLDNSAMNLARAELEAWDVQFDYKREMGLYGTFDWFFMGTWQPHYQTQTLRGEPSTENAGIGSNNPLKFKASAGMSWTRQAVQVGWFVTHFDAYQVSSAPVVILRQGGSGEVSSQTYHDAFIQYDFALAKRGFSRWLDGAEIQFGIRNIFNEAPPLDVRNTSGGFYSPFGNPRQSTYYISMNFRF